MYNEVRKSYQGTIKKSDKLGQMAVRGLTHGSAFIFEITVTTIERAFKQNVCRKEYSFAIFHKKNICTGGISQVTNKWQMCRKLFHQLKA